MNQHTFDTLACALAGLTCRRQTLRSLVSAGLGVGVLWRPADSDARKKRKKKRPPILPVRNEFGCVDVGQACNGDDSLCCSGICEGLAPKKGQADTSRCVAHDTGICSPDSNACILVGPVGCGSSNADCYCLQTTGNGSFCGNTGGYGDLAALCRDCHRDTDCQQEFGPGAACVDFREGFCEDICSSTGGTACVPACLVADM
jgi:hypothetical protein